MNSLLNKQWHTPEHIDSIEDLYALLQKKQIASLENPDYFFSPSFSDLHSPFLFPEMSRVVDRIQKSIHNKERIMIFGDFDADGITSTVILFSVLQSLGALVSYRIPDRNTDSHGLKPHLVDEIHSHNVDLIITCDCGINDAKALAHAQNLGIDVIVTDHHTPDPTLTKRPAFALLNPLLEDCSYPEKHLSGSAIAFKLAQALLESTPTLSPLDIQTHIQKLLEVATIGLVADCVPLTGEVRTLVQLGLKALQSTQWPSLERLYQEQNIDPKTIDTDTIGFVIAPRLNAASRLGNVQMAVQFFIGKQESMPEKLDYLETLNKERRIKTQTLYDESLSCVRSDAPFQLLFGSTWEPGILGLMASRHANALSVPVVACSQRSDGYIGGSCRAPEGYSIIEGLQSCQNLFISYGGHDGAAGFLTTQEKLPEIMNALDLFFQDTEISQKTHCDAFLSPQLLSLESLDAIRPFGPFGVGNPKPVFGISNILIHDIYLMGDRKNHMRITGIIEDQSFSFLAFFAESFIPMLNVGNHVDILFTLQDSFWKDTRKLDIHITDIRKHT